MLAGAAEPKQAAPKQKRWGKSRPYFGTIIASQGLCNIASKDDKDTIRVEVDLGDSGLSYTPGDALGIIPLNCHEVASLPLQKDAQFIFCRSEHDNIWLTHSAWQMRLCHGQLGPLAPSSPIVS